MMWLLLWLFACDGTPPLTETGNPDLAGRMALIGHTTAPIDVSVGTGDGAIDVDTAVVAVSRVRLVMGEACDAPGEVEWDVPAPDSVDLLAPEGVDFDAKSGDYCRVRVRLDGDGDVLRIAGTLDDDDERFEIRSRRRQEIDVRSRGEPFPLEEGTERLLLGFDASLWLDEDDLDDAEVGVDGVVHIDDDNNEDLLDAFEDAVAASLALFADLDGDEVLDDDEGDPLATGG